MGYSQLAKPAPIGVLIERGRGSILRLRNLQFRIDVAIDFEKLARLLQKAADVPAGEVCGPAVAESGHEFFKVADVPGWQDYDVPELRKRSKS